MFKQNILYNDFFDDFDSPSLNYSVITNGATPTIGSNKSCAVITAGALTSGYYAFLTPHQPNGYTNCYGAKIWISFRSMQAGKAYPEIGFFNNSTSNILLSVNDTTGYFCIRYNSSIHTTTDLLFEANKNYIAYIDFKIDGSRISLAIGEYNTVDNFSNIVNKINDVYITPPSGLYLPVFGMTLYETFASAPKIAYDYFGYSCRRQVIPAL